MPGNSFKMITDIEHFCRESYDEFSHLGDYIWKMYQQIDSIRQVELRKLDDYFPNDPIARAWRWKRESERLDYIYPLAFNYSAVVQIFLTFETRLRRTCDLIYETKKLPIRAKELSGSTIERYLTYLDKFAGVEKIKLTLWQQIVALTKIRNCIVHTSGFFQDSSDSDAIRRLIKDRDYLSVEHRHRRRSLQEKTGKVTPSELMIESTESGERIVVTMDYSFVACSYCRDSLLEIFQLAGLISENT
jgi:hypothetical protein